MTKLWVALLGAAALLGLGETQTVQQFQQDVQEPMPLEKDFGQIEQPEAFTDQGQLQERWGGWGGWGGWGFPGRWGGWGGWGGFGKKGFGKKGFGKKGFHHRRHRRWDDDDDDGKKGRRHRRHRRHHRHGKKL